MHDPAQDNETLHDQARKITSQGHDIRQKIEDLVKRCAQQANAGGKRLSDIAQEVLDGAMAGIRQSAPKEDQPNRFRMVIDGLGDGFTKAATSIRLSFDEATSRGDDFARTEVSDMLKDLRALSDMFAEVVTRTGVRASNLAKKEFIDLGDHARRLYESVKPPLKDAAASASQDPAKRARETADALGAAGRQAAGALLGAVGEILKTAADRLDPKQSQSSGTGSGGTGSSGSAGGSQQGDASQSGGR